MTCPSFFRPSPLSQINIEEEIEKRQKLIDDGLYKYKSIDEEIAYMNKIKWYLCINDLFKYNIGIFAYNTLLNPMCWFVEGAAVPYKWKTPPLDLG